MIYYVSSSSGDDVNNGTSQSTPWESLNKSNQAVLQPGDSVLFKRGDTIKGFVEATASGTSINRITYGAYGSGARPILTQRNPITGWDTSDNWTLSNSIVTEAKPYSRGLGSYDASDLTANVRTVIRSNYFISNASKFRVAFEQSTASSTTIISAFIGELDSNVSGYAMKSGTIQPITFIDNNVTATKIYSDWMTYAIDKTKAYVVSVAQTGGYVGLEGSDWAWLHISDTSTVTEEASQLSPETIVKGDSAISLCSFEISDNTQKSWFMNLGGQGFPQRMWFDGIEYVPCGIETNLSLKSRWFIDRDGDKLWVFSNGNPATTYSSIEKPRLNANNSNYPDSTFLLNGKNYITVKDIDIRGGHTGLYFIGSSYAIIEDCNIGFDSGVYGVWIQGNCANGIIRRCTIDSGDRLMDEIPREYGSGCEEGINMNAGTGWRIYNNKVKNWGHSGIYLISFNQDYPCNDNRIYMNEVSAPNVEYCRAIGTDGTWCANNKFYLNYFHDLTVGSQVNGFRTKVYANIFNNIRNSQARVSPTGFGINISGYASQHPREIVISNNVFANCDEAGIDVGLIANLASGLIEGCTISNNIFYNTGTSSRRFIGKDVQLKIGFEGYTGLNSYENNLFYTSVTNDGKPVFYDKAGTGSKYMTVQQFNAANGSSDTVSNNISSNPMFVNAEGFNFALTSSSPGNAAGKNISAIDADLSISVAADSQWPDSVIEKTFLSVWDIGPYIHTADLVIKGVNFIIA